MQAADPEHSNREENICEKNSVQGFVLALNTAQRQMNMLNKPQLGERSYGQRYMVAEEFQDAAMKEEVPVKRSLSEAFPKRRTEEQSIASSSTRSRVLKKDRKDATEDLPELDGQVRRYEGVTPSTQASGSPIGDIDSVLITTGLEGGKPLLPLPQLFTEKSPLFVEVPTVMPELKPLPEKGLKKKEKRRVDVAPSESLSGLEMFQVMKSELSFQQESFVESLLKELEKVRTELVCHTSSLQESVNKEVESLKLTMQQQLQGQRQELMSILGEQLKSQVEVVQGRKIDQRKSEHFGNEDGKYCQTNV
jgi:hypothetical protein